ncbi:MULTISPECIES: hypothetical protein [Acidithrix]|uniref:Uncharacterized protein n=1 Tax=Acidithrix ferrooxidans TaxID=1280514 RepID=A0A0D8HGQ6_9ACTN|nr:MULTISPECIES: hypothetical protein [Acidithrix]KJF16261.1 hypothetical protein AXFE_29010 [Acidithrix ferrooxidans]CAG4932492.1 unnamed protein product [Acidithrix sp. C25]
MASVTFEAETLEELVSKMKLWIHSADQMSKRSSDLSGAMGSATEVTSELAKAAIELIARSAPEPVSSSEIFKRLTSLGFEVTETAKRTVTSTLDALSETEGDEGIMDKVDKARDAAIYEMSQAVARGVLKIIGL